MGVVAYCDDSDLYLYGLPRGAAAAEGRLVGEVDTAADTIELNAHGFTGDEPIAFRAEAGGSLPSPLVAGTTYYAAPVDEWLFQVAASAGGAALNLTTAGANVVVITPLPREAAREWATAVIDDMLPAHLVPLSAPYPPIVRMTCAELANAKLGFSPAQKALTDIADAAQARLKRWASGVPIRGEDAPAPANLAAAGAVAVGAADTRGWRRWGGIA